MTPSRYRRHQVQAPGAKEKGRGPVSHSSQSVSQFGQLEPAVPGRGRDIDSRNHQYDQYHQYANYPQRRCVISMWGNKSGPFPSSVSPVEPAEGYVLGSFNPDR